MLKIPGVISGDFYYLYHDETAIRNMKSQKIVHIEKNPRSYFWGFLLFNA